MNMELLNQEIAKIEASIDQYNEADTIVIYDSINAIREAGYQLDAVEPLLQLMERHPTTYFGDPGAIVDFIESLGKEYEAYLFASVKRTPTNATVWMINRCINARESKEDKEKLIEILKEITCRTDIDKDIKERAQEYIDFQILRACAPN